MYLFIYYDLVVLASRVRMSPAVPITGSRHGELEGFTTMMHYLGLKLLQEEMDGNYVSLIVRIVGPVITWPGIGCCAIHSYVILG